MLYPECCYRIGNEFEQDSKGRGLYFAKFDETYSVDVGLFVVGTKDGHITTDIPISDVRLVSITAETLAELARENGEDFILSMKFRGMVGVMIGKTEEDWDYHQNKDEPLGEFFLRVAKLRKYIK